MNSRSSHGVLRFLSSGCSGSSSIHTPDPTPEVTGAETGMEQWILIDDVWVSLH